MSFFKQLYETIRKYQTIIIHRHVNPDPDAIGSQKGLAELIKANFANKQVYCVGRNIESLAFMGQMDEITDEMYQQALVIVTDTANSPRIDDARYQLGAYVIKIDHHPNEEPYGDLVYVDTHASSTSEIITAFAKDYALMMPTLAAKLLYAGIVGDTGRFLYAATSAKTLQLAAYLRQYDFSATDISYEMVTKSPELIKLCGYVWQELVISNTGVAHVVISQAVLNQYGLTDEHTAAVVSLPGEVTGVLCWGVFVEQANGKYRCRLRSKGPHINQIAAAHHGGGHPLASGANAKDMQEIELILDELEKVAKDYSDAVTI